MKIEEVVSFKTLLVIGIVLLILAVSFGSYIPGLRAGSIIPQAITTQTINGVDYAIVSMDGLNYGDTDIGTIQDTSSQHYDVDGNTNSDGKIIEGDFDVIVKLKVLNTGWSMQTTPYKTDDFVNKVWVEECGWFNEKTCTRTEAPSPITYYHVTHDMTPLAEYEVWAVINGVEQDHIIVTPKNTQQTITVPGTDPAIYWRETSYGIDGQSKVPQGAENVDILRKDGAGNVIFADRNRVDVAVEFWNAIFYEDFLLLRNKYNNEVWIFTQNGIQYDPTFSVKFEDNIAQRLDFNGDEKYDLKVSAPVKEFDIGDLAHNEYQFKTCDGLGCMGADSHWFDMPSLHRSPYMSDKDTDGYTLSGNNEFLLRDGRITISGTFQIPLEYGDVQVITRDAIPKIVSESETFEVFDGGFKEVTVSVKNNGETGNVIVIPELKEGNVGSVSLPDAQDETIPAGETMDFVFKFDSNTAGIGSVIFYANAGTHQDSIEIEFEVIAPPEDAERYSVRIVAINPQGTELESLYPGKFSLTVDQNDATYYGVWEGQLWEGSPTVSGQTIVVDDTTWYPEPPKTITIDEEGKTFTFIYSTEKEDDGIAFIWYIIGGVVIGLLILGFYIYKTEYMDK